MSQGASISQMNELSRMAIDAGHDLPQMMELAGYHLARFTTHRYPAHSNKNVLVVCGSGNNGGGGLVCAKHLQNAGHKVSLFVKETDKSLSKFNQKSLNLLEKTGIERQKSMLDTKPASVVLDCLIGTGLKGSLKDDEMSIVRQINSSGKPIISLDIPSGVDADTGKPKNIAIRPDHTVCLGALKKGIIDNNTCGVAHVYDIGIPKVFYQRLKIEYPF